MGTPVAGYVAGLAPDAHPLDRGKPRDEGTEGGNQPADRSLINRRLSLRSQLCAARPFRADGDFAARALNRAQPLDCEHKRLAHWTRGLEWVALVRHREYDGGASCCNRRFCRLRRTRMSAPPRHGRHVPRAGAHVHVEGAHIHVEGARVTLRHLSTVRKSMC